jgi:hypothetical protein
VRAGLSTTGATDTNLQTTISNWGDVPGVVVGVQTLVWRFQDKSWTPDANW